MLEVPHESCLNELDLREYILACLHGYRATPDLPFTCPFLDHHLDALTVDVWGTEVGDCTGGRVVLLFGLTLRDSEGASISLSRRNALDCCGAETGCCSDTPAAFPFGRTLQDPKGAKDSPGLRSTYGLNCSGCGVAACLANASALLLIGTLIMAILVRPRRSARMLL